MMSRNRPTDPLHVAMESLRTTSRVPLEDRAVLAANIGRLAQRLDPERPLRGARMIVNEAARENSDTLWEKRKRVLRLPGEPCPAANGNADYAGRGTNFHLVAKAAVTLLAGPAPDREGDRRALLREILSGTSYLPAGAALARTDADATALLERFAARICKIVDAGSRVTPLWKLLDKVPIELGPAYLSQGPHVTGLLAEIYSYPCVLRVGSAAGEDRGWADPRLPIGIAVHSLPALLFRLPPDLAELMVGLEEDEVPDEIVEFLEAIDWQAGHYAENGPFMPACRFSWDQGYGWQAVDLRLARKLTLRVCPNEQGMALMLDVVGGHDLGVRPDQQLLFDPDLTDYDLYTGGKPAEEAAVAALAAREEMRLCRQVKLGADYPLALWSPIGATACEEERTGFTGFSGFYRDADWRPSFEFDPVASGWTGQPAIQDLLVSPRFTFYPSIGAPDSDTPFAKNTVAAALIRNVLAATPEADIAHQLAIRAEALADATFAFWEELHARAGAALDN